MFAQKFCKNQNIIKTLKQKSQKRQKKLMLKQNLLKITCLINLQMDKVKLKTRSKLSALDLKYLANNFSKQLSGCVLNNIYDITVKTYLFKMGRANQRENLLIESGNKMHLQEGYDEVRDRPNKFTQKLRKHIRGLFIESIEQIGVERVIRVTFKGADKENKAFTFFLYLEFYAKGNIILTDADQVVLACLRDHQYSETEKVQFKEKYPLHRAASMYFENITISKEKFEEIVTSAKNKKNGVLVSQLVPCAHQQICDILIQEKGLDPNGNYDAKNSEKLIGIAEQIKEYFANKKLSTEEEIKEFIKGYIYFDKQTGKSFEFSPVSLPYVQLYPTRVTEQICENFNQCLVDHFKQFNQEKSAEEVEQEIEKEAMKKYQKIQQDQQGRLTGIQNQIEQLTLHTQLLEQHINEVDGIIQIVNDLIGMGISNLIKDSIQQAQKEGDPLAKMIQKVVPESMTVHVNLKDAEDKDVCIKIDLKMNASLNANQFYQNRKKLIEKEAKTKQATEDVLKRAHQLALKEIQNKKVQFKKKVFDKERKVYWFEKFYWFLTSENYLVITARDAQQNEVLIKRYLNKGDIVFHAHIQGSAFTVIKNHTDQPVSMISIQETAVAALAHSKAWNLNVVVEVYWVYANQVSKTAPTGLSMPSGSFMIYGKKNFINPFKLEMGFGLLFRVDDESAVRHKGERKIKTDLVSTTQTIEEAEEDNQDDQLQRLNSIEQIAADMDAKGETTIQIEKKQKNIGNQIQVKKNKQDKKKEKQKEKEPEKKTDVKGKTKKVNKKKQKKMDDYLEKFGGETKEEEEMRMKVQGFKKNFKLEEQKKEYEWANDEAQEIKFEEEIIEEEEKEHKEQNEEVEEKQKEKKKFMEILNVGQQEENLEENFFEKFTAIPRKEDLILQLFPVCAPYHTLQKYKYKVKLLPGPMKRGKALKFIQELFLKGPGEEQEKEFVKYLPENIGILQITGNSKVQAAGINKIKKTAKNQKKKAKKNQ